MATRRGAIALVLGLSCAAGVFSLVSRRQHEVVERHLRGGSRDPSAAAAQGRGQLEALAATADKLKSEGMREKLERAYDGATRTHEIGFGSK